MKIKARMQVFINKPHTLKEVICQSYGIAEISSINPGASNVVLTLYSELVPDRNEHLKARSNCLNNAFRYKTGSCI